MAAPGGRRAGLIGVGAISDWHVRALRAAGVEVTAVATRAGSTRLDTFAAEHAIPRVFERWERLLEARDVWDGLVVATHTDGTADVVAAALSHRVPLLVEKPVAWNSTAVARLRAIAHPHVIVGFNRRYYRPVRFVGEECRQGLPVVAHLELPESVAAPLPASARDRLAPFFSNSCHGFDLLRFVLGPLRVQAVERLRAAGGGVYALTALLRAERGHTVTVTCNWSTPANFALTVDRPGRRVELRPFECATVYEGMDVLEPSDDFPVRRYAPRLASRVVLDEVDAREKPGFVQQARAFAAMLDGQAPPPEAATLADAEAAIHLCEELLGATYPPRADAAGGRA